MTEEKIAIIGAGLVGCLAALYLNKLGYKVTIFEARPDPRSSAQKEFFSKRSINLAISERGLFALECYDPSLKENVLKNAIPMSSRLIHDINGKIQSQIYGSFGESINSIDRALLNNILLDKLEKSETVTINFNHKLINADFDLGSMQFLNTTNEEKQKDLNTTTDIDKNLNKEEKISYDGFEFIVGADGSFSSVRRQLQRKILMSYEQKYIEDVYLELKIPAKINLDGSKEFYLSPDGLHIWPRKDFMLIALPNRDYTFTCTLFAPRSIFNKLTTKKNILEFFKLNFSDALNLIGPDQLVNSFENHPKGNLVSVKCSSYNFKGKCIIIGDAAHSMVPFYGQGMNCGFEDVRVLAELIEKHKKNKQKNSSIIEEAFDEYSKTRHKDLITICDLAMENYVEMRSSVITVPYIVKRKVEGLLERLLKDNWLRLYTMVSFRHDISYSAAYNINKWHSKVLSVTFCAFTGIFFGILSKVFKKH